MSKFKLKSKETYFFITIIIISLIIRIFYILQPFKTITSYLYDDAYYYFSIARNFARGKGIVFNDHLPTNGFHPLYFYILVVIYFFFPSDIYTPIYIALFILCLFNIGTGIFLYFIGKNIHNQRTGVIASLLWLFNPYFISITLMGMETPIQVFFISILTNYLIKIKKENQIRLQQAFLIAILISLIILSRLDGVLYFAAIIFIIYFKKIGKLKKEDQFNIKEILKTLKDRNLFVIVLIPSLVLICWIVWSLITVGLLLPTSGAIKISILKSIFDPNYLSRIFFEHRIFLAYFINIIYNHPGNYSLQLFLLIVLVVIPLIIVSFYCFIRKDLFLKKTIKYVDFLIISFLFFYIYYIFVQMNTWPWYALFPCFCLTIFITIFFSFSIDKIEKIQKLKMALRLKLRKFFIFFCLLIFSLSYSYNFVDITTHYPENGIDYELKLSIIEYIEENVPEDKKIGSFNAGCLHYYSLKRDIINLDGVVNSESYNAIVNNYFEDYLLDNEIRYLVDNEPYGLALNKSDKLDLIEIKYFGYFYNPYDPSAKSEFYLWEIIKTD